MGVLKRLARQDQPPAEPDFDSNTTFPGLKPYEAVYLPRGLFLPLSAIPARLNPNERKAATLTSGITAAGDGIAPLSVVALAQGVFVPNGLAGMIKKEQ